MKRLKGGKVELVPVTVGLRDALRERVVVTGVSRGDTVLLGGAIGHAHRLVGAHHARRRLIGEESPHVDL